MDHTDMAAHLTRSDFERFLKEDGDVWSEGKEEEGTGCEDGDSDTD
jgi:hypothetical protein